MPEHDIFVAKESFATTVDGQPVSVQKGVTRVRAGHPLLKGKEMFFEPLTVQYDVERATKSPGEQRGEQRGAPPASVEPFAQQKVVADGKTTGTMVPDNEPPKPVTAADEKKSVAAGKALDKATEKAADEKAKEKDQENYSTVADADDKDKTKKAK